MSPSIHIGPGDQPELARAVETAGGSVVSLGQADGVVWAGTKPDSLPELPRSVRWVQLPSAGLAPWMSRIAATPNVTFTSAPRAAGGPVPLRRGGVRAAGGRARARAAAGRPARDRRLRARAGVADPAAPD